MHCAYIGRAVFMKVFSQIAVIFVIAVIVPLVLMRMVISGMTTFMDNLLIMLVLAGLIFLWTYETMIKPLNELKKGTRKIKDGDLDFTLESDSSSELGELVRSFEEMRVRLKESQNQKVTMDNESRELIRNIAHDLKTPITTIRGYSEGILDGVADTPEKQQKYLKTIHSKAEEMTRLIDELSFYSKVDTNKIPYSFRKLPVREFFDDCADEIKTELEGNGLQFFYTVSVRDGTKVIGDPEQLKKVINNIIGNSVKYMDKNNGKISMILTDTGDFVQCDMTDNGRGVDKQDLSKIYDRFYRTDTSRGTAAGGSGIGLSIAKKIIEDHGGSIWASGEPGEGLTQHFILRKIE